MARGEGKLDMGQLFAELRAIMRNVKGGRFNCIVIWILEILKNTRYHI